MPPVPRPRPSFLGPNGSIREHPSLETIAQEEARIRAGKIGRSQDSAGKYSALIFDTAELHTTPLAPIERVFETSGDHLYCAELSGPVSIYARLGPRSNPLIRLREGMTLKRDFSRVTLVTWDASVSISAPLSSAPVMRTRALCYSSWGPLIEGTPHFRGGRAGPTIFKGTATTTGTVLFQTSLLTPDPARFTVGKHGGFFLLQNLGLTQVLKLYWGARDSLDVFGAPLNNAFRLGPGRTLSYPLEDSFETVYGGWKVVTDAGTVDYVTLLSSSEKDLMDWEQLDPKGIST